MINKEKIFSFEMPHESAEKHVTGLAKYTDDIIEPKETLHTGDTVSKMSNDNQKWI